MQTSDHIKGLAITAAGVAVLSLDAPLIRLIHADTWTVALWRGLLMAVGFAALALLQSPGDFRRDVKALSRYDVLAAVCFAIGNLCFVVAAKLIPVANLLLIIATTPLAAAATARLLLGERLRLSTGLAILGALVGITILVAGELRLDAGLIGHGIALVTPLATGLFFTLLRRTGSRGSGPILALAGLSLGIILLPVAWPATVPSDSLPYLLLLGLGIIPVAFTLIAKGPRYLPAAEASLLMLLETVLGPIWAWMLLSEMPSNRAFVGGAVVLGSVAGHVLASQRANANRRKMQSRPH